MKKLILLLAVTFVVFSCSKDNVATETETTADLTQMIPNKALDQSSEGFYYGVFAHNENLDLHGKILINAGNDGTYSAFIDMVNGDDINFRGVTKTRTNIHFTSDRGSFDFNTIDYSTPVATNVVIDGAESYIVTLKATSRRVPTVILGTYVETGNETGFYGVWDLVGADDAGSGPFGGEHIAMAVVSHKGNRGPFIDASMEPSLQPCIGPTPPFVLDVGGFHDVWSDDQVSDFAGYTSLWNIKSIVGFHGDFAHPYSPPGDCLPGDFGTWTWAGRTGTLHLDSPPPPPTNNDGQNRVMASPYIK